MLFCRLCFSDWRQHNNTNAFWKTFSNFCHYPLSRVIIFLHLFSCRCKSFLSRCSSNCSSTSSCVNITYMRHRQMKQSFVQWNTTEYLIINELLKFIVTICSNLFFHIFCCQLDPLTATGFYLTINVVFTPYLWCPSKRRFRYHPLIEFISLYEVASSNKTPSL